MEKALEPRDYVEIFMRRKWLFIIPFVLICALTAAYLRYAPRIYRASTLILVEPPRVPNTYVQPVLTTERVQDQLRTVREQIMSRRHLERVIEELNLYPELRKRYPLESVIGMMRKRVSVDVLQGRIFRVSFQDPDPVTAMKGANRLTSLFIEENLKMREEMAEGTLAFLERELERVRSLLKEQEKKIADFRAKHLGVLPEQLEANLRTLDRLQMQLRSTIEALNAAEQRKAHLQQLARLSRSATASTTPERPEAGREEQVPARATLESLKARLRELLSRYTERHPEVIRVKDMIAKVEREVELEELQRRQQQAQEEGAASAREEEAPPSPDLTFQRELAQLDAEIIQLKAEQRRLKAQIKEYERRVELTPKVEEQLKELTRGYEVTQRQYQSLLDRKLQAEVAANLERKQKGERFRVIEEAKVPTRPYKPDFRKVALFGFIVATAVGGGLVVLVESLDNSFYKAEDVEQVTELPVIANIPKVKKIKFPR